MSYSRSNLRTKGTGYKYFQAQRPTRMSREDFIDALRTAQKANAKYKFKSFLVRSCLEIYREEFQGYWRKVFQAFDTRNRELILGLVPALVVLPTSNMDEWRLVCARVRDHSNQASLVQQVAAVAAISMLKMDTPERLRQLCEIKAEKLGMDSDVSEPLITACCKILEELDNVRSFAEVG